MNRRQFLSGVGTSSVLSSAGCVSFGSSTTLSKPTEEAEADGETHLHFTGGGGRLATLSVQPDRHDSGPSSVPVDVSIWHRDGTQVTHLTLAFRTPPSGQGAPGQVAVTIPQWNPHPAIELYTDRDDGGSVLQVDDMNGQGNGTVTFELVVTPADVAQTELLVDAAVGLEERGLLGQNYALDGQTVVPLR